MAYIEMHQSLYTHRKTLRLARLLGMDRFAAAGRLGALWSWALDNAQDGAIHKSDSDILADVMGWVGDPNELCTALVDAEFLEDDGHTLWIHEWNGGRHGMASVNERNAIRRAWEATAKRVRPIVMKRDGYRCRICGRADGVLEIDHIVPVARGGSNRFDNLRVLCLPCNRSKGAS